MRHLFFKLAKKAGAEKPKELSAHLLTLLDGALVERRLYGQRESKTGLKAAATTLINSQLK